MVLPPVLPPNLSRTATRQRVERRGRSAGRPARATPLVDHILPARGALVTGTAEHLVHALTRDAERTGKLGLASTRLMRGEEGVAEVAPGAVEALKRVECLLIGTQHGLDFDVVCHVPTIARKGTLHVLTQP